VRFSRELYVDWDDGTPQRIPLESHVMATGVCGDPGGNVKELKK